MSVSQSVQSLSRVRLFVTPWSTACQASLTITNSWSSIRLMSIESVKPSRHLTLGRPLLLLPPIPPSIRVFSSEATLRMWCPKYWSFSFSIIPSKEICTVSENKMEQLLCLRSMFCYCCLLFFPFKNIECTSTKWSSKSMYLPRNIEKYVYKVFV